MFKSEGLDAVLIVDFSLFIPRLSCFQTSKLPLRSPISVAIERGQMWFLWRAVLQGQSTTFTAPDKWAQKWQQLQRLLVLLRRLGGSKYRLGRASGGQMQQ